MKNYLLLGITICSLFTFGQDYRAVWQQCYGDEGDNHFMAICPSSDGYLFAYNNCSGVNATNFHGVADIWIQRFDTLHNRIWERCYGGSYSEGPIKLLQINNNQFYMFGYTYSTDGDVQSGNNGFEYSDVWVVKLTDEGNIVWEKTYGCEGYDDPRDMVLTPDGGFVFMDRIGMGGGDVTNFYGSGDVWLCKCDSMGNIEWEKTLGNEGLDNGLSLLINSKGNIMMLGAAQKTGGMITCIPDGWWADVWLVELDMQGNIVWQECYGGSEYDCGINLVEIDDGFIFIGVSASNDGDVSGHHGGIGMDGNIDLWAVRINQTGEIVWQKSFGGTENDDGGYIFVSETNEIAIIGSTQSHDGDVSGNHSLPDGYNRDVWLLRLNMDGELLYQQCIGSKWDNAMHLHNVIQKKDENFLVSAFIQQRPADGDVLCSLNHDQTNYYDIWLFEIKDCTLYAPTIPVQPAGPAKACSASPNPGIYTVPAVSKQTTEWKLEPSEAGSIITGKDSLLIYWSNGYEGTVAITARGINDCGASAWSQPIYTQVETCAGISTHSLSGLKIWPNPAKTHLNIEIPSNIQLPVNIQISDVSGRRLMSQTHAKPQITLDVSNLGQGVYLLTLTNTSQVIQHKIIKE